MFNFMGKKAHKWLITLVFGIIIVTFTLNFGPWAGSGPSDNITYAAKVNNKSIPMAEFRTAYLNQLARIRQFRPDYEESEAEKDQLRQMVIEQLIMKELLTQLGQEQNLKVSSKFLAEQIKKQMFGEEENFNREEYEKQIRLLQTTVSKFEKMVEKDLIAQQMLEILSSAVYISDKEAKEEFENKNNKVSIEYVKTDPKYIKPKDFSKQEVDSYINNNENKISEYYEKNITDFIKEDEVRASHILIKIDQNATDEVKEQKRAEAQKILDRINSGEDFASLAKELSEDPGSKEKGGDLDFFTRGKMVDEFSNAAFALNKGEVSKLVESPFGIHIIKVTDIRAGEKRDLEQATYDIAKILLNKNYQNEKAKEEAKLALAQMSKGIPLDKISIPGLLNKKAKEKNKPELFQPIADETTKFSKSNNYIPKIGRSSEVIAAAFSLKNPGDTPGEVISSNDQYFAIRLKERENADMSKFAEEKEALKQRLSFPRKRAFLQQYLENLKKDSKIQINPALMGNKETNL